MEGENGSSEHVLRISLQEKGNDIEMEESKLLSERKQLPYRDILHSYNPCCQHDDVHYSDNDDNEVVDEVALDYFINRILFSATHNEKDQDTHGIANPDDGQMMMPNYAEQRVRRPRRNDRDRFETKPRKMKTKNEEKKEKKMRVEDYICDKMAPVSAQKSREPLICMPLRIYRKLVNAEIESKTREMYEYFEMQNSRLEESRVKALRESFLYQDKLSQCERSMSIACAAVKNIHENCEELQQEVVALKEAKRRRRLAKKQRNKSEKMQFSKSETGTESSARPSGCEDSSEEES